MSKVVRGAKLSAWGGALAVVLTASQAVLASAAPSPDVASQKPALAAAADCSVPAARDLAVTRDVYDVAVGLGVSDKVLLAGFEAGWVESHMNNLRCGDRDSQGVFQQRPSQGWGTEAQVTNVRYAANSFFTRAIDQAARNPSYSAGEVAQAVQRSAFPARYDEAAAKARALIEEVARTDDLYLVKTKETTSGRVEVQSASASSDYQSALAGGAATRFAATEAANGTFVIDNGDLYYIKTKNTESGMVEVHSATQTSGYQARISRGVATRFFTSDAARGTFTIDDGNLYLIKTTDTGGDKVQVHSASAASNYQSSVAGGTNTRFFTAEAGRGTFTIDDGNLYLIKTTDTGGDKVQVHSASAASNYQSSVAGGTNTRFFTAEAGRGTFTID